MFLCKKNEIYDLLAKKVDLEFDRNVEDGSSGYKFGVMVDDIDIMSNVLSDVRLKDQSIHLILGLREIVLAFFWKKILSLDINGLHFNLIFEHFFEEHDKVKIGLELMKCSMKQILDEFLIFITGNFTASRFLVSSALLLNLICNLPLLLKVALISKLKTRFR